MANPLSIAPPPPRRASVEDKAEAKTTRPKAGDAKFDQGKEDDRVQFNKRVTRRVSDGFEMLAIRTRRKVPELLAEALELLEQTYGKV